MTGRQAATIAAILLIALAVVGLVLLRPMAPENYAVSGFDFEAVTEIHASAGTYEVGVTAPTLLLDPEDEAFETLIGLFDGRGFGRTPASVFSQKPAVSRVGDIYWTVTFRCGAAGASLTAECKGSDLRLIGADAAVVTTQDKSEWTLEVHDLVLSLYPEPEPEPEEPEDTSDNT